MVVIFIEFGVELHEVLSITRASHIKRVLRRYTREAYQIKDRYLHHALIKVGRAIFNDFDGDDFLRLQVLTFHDLAKCSLAKNIQNEIPISSFASVSEEPPG